MGKRKKKQGKNLSGQPLTPSEKLARIRTSDVMRAIQGGYLPARASDEKYLSIPELSERFGIPQPTIRRYIERHGHHLFVRKHHKGYLIAEKSLQELIKIRESYADGMNGDQVEEQLASTRMPTIIDVSEMMPEALFRLHSDLIERFERQENFNRALLGALEQERDDNRKQIEAITVENTQLRQELDAARREASAATEQLIGQIADVLRFHCGRIQPQSNRNEVEDDLSRAVPRNVDVLEATARPQQQRSSNSHVDTD